MIYIPWSDKNSYLIHPSASKGYCYALNAVDEKAEKPWKQRSVILKPLERRLLCFKLGIGNGVNSENGIMPATYL